MAEMYLGVNNTNPGRAAGNKVLHRGLRDGTALFADQAFSLGLEGKVFVANGGADSSPITFATAYDADGPDFVIDVPDGKTVVPLAITVDYQTVGTTGLLETFVSISNTLGAVSAGTLVTPVNINIGNAATSSSTVNAAVDAAGCTVQSGRIFEFDRGGFQLAEDMAATEDWAERAWRWSAKREGYYPIIKGAGSLFIHAAAVAGVGFITVVYAEFDTDELL